MNPKHIKKIEQTDRIAKAPYNFVELPEKVVEAELPLPEGDRYHPDRHTGRIECTLTTESPLYIRCGMTSSDFIKYSEVPEKYLKPPKDATEKQKKQWEEEKKQWETERKTVLAPFFTYRSDLLPVLPGSSLRGMLRTLVEIITFSKIERVSDQQKFFFRAVAADKDDPLSNPYKDRLKNVRAGYLEFDKKQNKSFIRPAQEIEGQLFMEVKEEEIKDDLPSLILMKKANYIPQYIKISFEVTAESINVSEDLIRYSQQGWLVTSGNMLENILEKTTEQEREKLLQRKEGRKYHYIIGEADKSAKRIEISSDAIRDYRDALTNFQHGKEKPFKDNPKNRFDEKMGILQEGLPIFYCEPQNGQPIVTFFGQSPNFRIPYSPNNNGQAASAVDFIPKEIGESDLIDLADAIFGFVRGEKKDKTEQDANKNGKEKREQSRAGRIFVSDAHYQSDEDGIWLVDQDKTITPQILASPKPTTFQHYLVQTTHEKPTLKHYASKPNEETVIRGHKLYWHKPNDWHKPNVSKEKIKTDATEAEIQDKRSQYTEIKPIKAGVSFKFTINFENLSDVELGALLWILTLANDKANPLNLLNLDAQEKYRLSLGMGKPLGMGAVAIEKYELVLNERYKNKPNQRYTKLFDGDNWLIGNHAATDDEYIRFLQQFETYIIANIDEADLPEDCTERKSLKLKDLPRIQMLLAMLSWNCPQANETRYMEIERKVSKGYLGKDVKPNEENKDEYEDRLVLPTPLQVKGWEDKRKFPNPVQPSLSTQKTSSKQGNPNLAMERGKKPPKHK